MANAGELIYDVEFNIAQLSKGQSEIDKKLSNVENRFDKTGAVISKIASAISVALSAKAIVDYANAWVEVNNKLINSVKASESLAEVTQRVFDISQETRSSLSATATLYGRLERATRSAGVSTEDLAKLTTTINKGLVVSGATAVEAAGAITQLSQGLASGVLRGEEFNSLTENGSRLTGALADSLGVTIGELRKMAAAGQLTTDVVVKGLLSQGDVIGREFGNTVMTMSQAFEVAGNNAIRFAGQSSLLQGFITSFNQGLILVSNNLEIVSGILIAVAAVVASKYVGALTAATAQTLRTAAAQGILATSAGLARSALASIGGPAGAAFLAASAIFYFFQKAQQAKQEAIEFADGLDSLIGKMRTMTSTQLSAEIANTAKALRGQTDAIEDQKEKVDGLTAKVQQYAIARKLHSGNTKLIANERDAVEELAIETAKLEEMESKNSKTKSTLNLLQSQLNGSLKTGIDLLKRDGQEAGIASGMMDGLGKAINFATKEKVKFNATSLNVERSADADKILADLKQENELLSIKDDKTRAIARASKDAMEKGAAAGSNQLRQIEEEAAKQYDLQQAKKDGIAANKAGAKAIKESEKEAQNVIDTLNRQKEAVERLNLGYSEGSIELAKYDAVKALGKNATEEQIQQAKDYAAAQWKATEAIKNLAQAEQGQKFAKQEIAAASVKVDPMTGQAVDPLAEINLKEQQKLDALAKYQAIDLANVQIYEDAKTAIQAAAAAERKRILDEEAQKNMQNISNLLGSASEGFSMIAGAISDSAGESSSAYRALFAVSKGFAIAQAALNAQIAISNAMAIPWPANIPAIAQAIASGAQVIGAVRGTNYGGARKNGGPVNAGSMYRVGEGGAPEIFQSGSKQFMIPPDNGKVISNKDSFGVGGGGAVVNLNIQNYSAAKIDQQSSRGSGGSVTIDMIVADIDGGGPIRQSIVRNTSATPRATE